MFGMIYYIKAALFKPAIKKKKFVLYNIEADRILIAPRSNVKTLLDTNRYIMLGEL